MQNYGRSIAKVALHFRTDPLDLSMEQINDFLYAMLKSSTSPSKSYFRHTVYGLKCLFKMMGKQEKALKMPPIRNNETVPVVLSCEEVKRMLRLTANLKHRVLIGLLYGSGLRMNEARKVKIADIDTARLQLRIIQSKGRKDRYVVLSKLLARGIKQYLLQEKPQVYLFNGQTPGEPMGERSIQWIINEAVERAGIQKPTTCHTLRHTFATHLLENGADLFSIKEQLGHARIETTLVYLHIAQFTPKRVKSPLDNLYQQ
ncbi:MAG: recombinase XerD [Epsilonproteobacteria bacterium]|nr:recombinase XerD [Campylobacterota bacterium]